MSKSASPEKSGTSQLSRAHPEPLEPADGPGNRAQRRHPERFDIAGAAEFLSFSERFCRRSGPRTTSCPPRQSRFDVRRDAVAPNGRTRSFRSRLERQVARLPYSQYLSRSQLGESRASAAIVATPHPIGQGAPEHETSAPVRRVLCRLNGVKQVGPSQWSALCPSHPDRSPSLRVGEGDDGRALVKCEAGCETPAVLLAVDLGMADLFPEGLARRRGWQRGHVYTDENGNPLDEPRTSANTQAVFDNRNEPPGEVGHSTVCGACEYAHERATTREPVFELGGAL